MHRDLLSLVAKAEDTENAKHNFQAGTSHHLCPQAVPAGRPESPLRTQTTEPDCQIPASNASSVTSWLCSSG